MGEIYTKQFGVNFKSEPDPIKPKLNRSLIFHNKVRTAAKETNHTERVTIKEKIGHLQSQVWLSGGVLGFYNQQSLQKAVHPRRNLVVRIQQLEHQPRA